MTGILLLDKPTGMTSFSAVNRVRRQLNIKKAGHTGTLDPMATGVLPILLGGATRFGQYLPSHNKAYIAGMRLGVTTDTLDITGTVLEEQPVTVSRNDIEAALAGFRGNIMQVPPMYSAKSQDGVRLYQLARQGVEVQREARPVEIFALELLEDGSLYAECSAGTYIRSLIDDLGRVLGCGACMASLRRVKANGYDIARCVTFEDMQTKPPEVIPIDQALAVYPSVKVSAAQAVRFCNGGALDLVRLQGLQAHRQGAGELYRVYDPEEKFLGLGKIDEDTLAVEKRLT